MGKAKTILTGSKPTMPSHAASTKTPETLVHPALCSWALNQRLEKLRKSYQHDQKSKPAEILSSSIGCPEIEAIRYAVTRLKRYEKEIRGAFEAEIEAGRAADTAVFWAAILSQKILPSVIPKINSLEDRLVRKFWETGGGGHGERKAVESAQGELERLKVALNRELVRVQEHAEQERTAAGDNSGSRAGVIAANRSPRIPPEKISFNKHTDGITAVPPYSNSALLNTYEELWPLLDQVRTTVINDKGKLSANKLQRKFKATELGKAAVMKDYERWIEDFAGKSPATAKNATLVFLETKTGRPRGSLKTLLSRARRARMTKINYR